jgi:hypothetical protein
MPLALLLASCVVSFPAEGLHGTEAGAVEGLPEASSAEASGEALSIDALVDGTLAEQTPGDGNRGDLTDVDATTDADACPAVCTNGCDDGTCVLSCRNRCTCPEGQHCVINCMPNKCNERIDCRAAKSCAINCRNGACSGPIECGAAACNIRCERKACNDQVDCTESSRCCVLCGPDSCSDVRCPSGCGDRCQAPLAQGSCGC